MIEKSILEKLLDIQKQLAPVSSNGPKIHMIKGFCDDCSYGCEGSCATSCKGDCTDRCAGCSGQCKNSCNHDTSY